MNVVLSKSDSFGVMAGILCMLHCATTPFLIFALAGSTISDAPLWWVNINYILLFFSFIAVLKSTQTTSLKKIRPLFWISWILLSLLIINENFGWVEFPEYFTYLAVVFIIVLHLYNRRYCKCKTERCCIDNE